MNEDHMKENEDEAWMASSEYYKLMHECEICQQHFNEHQDLISHIITHAVPFTAAADKSNAFRCDLCPVRKESKADIRYHIAKMHLGLDCCQYCHKIFGSPHTLVEHRTVCRDKMSAYKCKKCNARFRTEAKLRDHQFCDCYPEKCRKCGKVFPKKHLLKGHMKSHERKLLLGTHERTLLLQKFTCSICNLSYGTKSTLDAHMSEHEGNIPTLFRCDFCNIVLKKKSNFTRHILKHLDGPKPQCAKCEQTFTDRKQLKRHFALVHGLKESPFECKICQRTFTRQMYLQRHIKSVHEDVKEAMCKVCGRLFKRKAHLNIHMFTHSGEKPFSCTICNKKFVTVGNLRLHEIAVHKLLPWKCQVCGEGFKLKVPYEKHIEYCKQ